MTKADPEFVCLCIYQWSSERKQNILDKATISSDVRKNGRYTSERWSNNANPEGAN